MWWLGTTISSTRDPLNCRTVHHQIIDSTANEELRRETDRLHHEGALFKLHLDLEFRSHLRCVAAADLGRDVEQILGGKSALTGGWPRIPTILLARGVPENGESIAISFRNGIFVTPPHGASEAMKSSMI